MRILLTLAVLFTGSQVSAATQGDEYFERKVRPLLVKNCYRCHSAKKVRGRLRVDSRAALLKGGDSGPAIVPGHPERSRLIDAIGYGNVDLQMPPSGKLPMEAISDLTAWIKQGAPWPAGDSSETVAKVEEFDLARRKAAHWSWRPVQAVSIPTVKNTQWPATPIDRFLLARLEQQGLSPAPPADRATLFRRLCFDLIGLPPSPKEIESFLADRSESAVPKVVDRLLAHPGFGERWGRHWLDLVRYGETRGHEFDPPIPNAFQYRDYIIRALNADVPYNQLVVEHIAGDLLAKPRLNPRQHFNESILGTGFWFLGEEVHSPVDIRADQADRFDNRIDVMSKTFLGLTVACARCHDHKFDAISTKDYYSLFGFLESSSYRQVRFDSLQENQQLALEIARNREAARLPIQRALSEMLQPGVSRTAEYLLAARAILQGGAKGDSADVIFEDFESGTYDRWEVTGTAFGPKPQTLRTIASYQGRINARGTYFVNSHNIRNGEDVARGDAHTGRMTSKTFTIGHDAITMLVGGGSHKGKTCVDLLVAGKVVLSATGRDSNQMFPVRWDVRRWRGKQARIQIVDEATGGWGNIGVDHIVFTNQTANDATVRPETLTDAIRERIQTSARERKLDAAILGKWVAHLLGGVRDTKDPLHAWTRTITADTLPDVLRLLVQEGQRQQDASVPEKADVVIDYSRVAPGQWLPDDVAFGTGPVQAGDTVLQGSREDPRISFIDHPAAARVDPLWKEQRLAPGSENEPGALGSMVRSGRTIRTPTFRVKRDKVCYLLRGAGLAYASVAAHVMISGPLHGKLVRGLPASSQFHWVEHDLRAYKGQLAHLEFTAKSANFAVALVVQADQTPGALPTPNHGLLRMVSGATTPEELAQGYQRLFTNTVRRLAVDGIRGSVDAIEQARLANWLLQKGELFGLDSSAAVAKLAAAAAPAITRESALKARIQRESRLAPAMLEGSGVDEHVFLRGSHKTPGDVVPRRFLEALAGPERLASGPGSGRLELAQQMTDPEKNPFLARVMVNRIWHHLFGRGIVGSVDNFGVLGEKPTHPELLDHLALRFIEDGWSIKKTIRQLVLSRAYQMSSQVGATGATGSDQENLLLHRMRLRRLEGEAIRDALLSLSGRLDTTMYGASVPVYLSEFQQGRGRPSSGPLDGAGRRSVYLAVRRNFLSSLLLAFDTPSPFSTVGRRTVSNVPAQSLILMNDPFVQQQARLWAERTLRNKGSRQERIAGMYLAAFGRAPSAAEREACLEFLRRQEGDKIDSLDAWADLAHALVNVKEFIFLR